MVEEGRTEEEKVSRAPIEVILGGKKYGITPLVIRDSREWRKKAGPFQASLSKYASISSDDPEAFEKSLVELLVNRIDQTIDLFFAYARDLDREAIESIASDNEIVKAYNIVFKFTFPFE